MSIYPLIGTELFPQTDAGQFIIDYRAPVGTRIELTEQLTERMENAVRQVIPPRELSTIVSNLGLAPGFSSIFSSNAAPDSGFMMVALKPTHDVSTFVYMHRLKSSCRKRCRRLQTIFHLRQHHRLGAQFRAGRADRRATQRADLRGRCSRWRARSRRRGRGVPEVAATFIPEESDYPTLRSRSTASTPRAWDSTSMTWSTIVITALTSNAMIAPSIWIEPKYRQ